MLGIGLGSCAAFLAGAAYAPDFGWLVALLGLAGAAGASVNSASGRAVMHWFGPSQRGLALGIHEPRSRQAAWWRRSILPHLGLRSGLLFLAGLCLAGAIAGVLAVRESHERQLPQDAVDWTLRDRRLWELSAGSGLYLVTRVALIGFVVLFLHDQRVSAAAAAAVLAAIQVGAAALRIGAGRWSDVSEPDRPDPAARLCDGDRHGLDRRSYRRAALAARPAIRGRRRAVDVLERPFLHRRRRAGRRRRSGAAIGFQQSVLAGVGAAAPVLFAALVAAISWRAGFALAALCPLAAAVVIRRVGV